MIEPIGTEPTASPKSSKGANFQNSWFGSIPEGFLIAAVVLYVAGSSYLSGYYSAFGVSLNDLNFDVKEVMALASRAFTSWWYAIVAVIVVVAWSCLWWRRRETQKREMQGVRREIQRQLMIDRYRAGDQAAYQVLLNLIFGAKHPASLVEGPASHEMIYRSSAERRSSDDSWSFSGVRLVWTTLLFCLGILVLQLTSWISIRRGRADAACEMVLACSDLPVARFVIDDKWQPQSLINPLDEYHLLAHGKTGYYIFKLLRPHQGDSRPLGLLPIVFVPDNAVLGAEFSTGIK